MKIWIKAVAVACMLSAATSCASRPYRQEFNWTAVFQAYTHYHLLDDHPFDDADVPSDAAALMGELQSALNERGMIAAQRDEERDRQVIMTLSYDINAGRRRVQIIAANQVRTWKYQMNRRDADPDMVALEIYERQTGSLIYRTEAKRGDTSKATIAALLSGYPPNTYLYRQAAQQRGANGL